MLKPVCLKGEGQAVGEKHGLLGAKMGSYVEHLQETDAFNGLTVERGGTLNSAPAAVRAVLPGADLFLEKRREDREGLLHQTLGQMMCHPIVTGPGGFRDKDGPGNLQPGSCRFAHYQHIQGGGELLPLGEADGAVGCADPVTELEMSLSSSSPSETRKPEGSSSSSPQSNQGHRCQREDHFATSPGNPSWWGQTGQSPLRRLKPCHHHLKWRGGDGDLPRTG